jgi:hypothetical protein
LAPLFGHSIAAPPEAAASFTTTKGENRLCPDRLSSSTASEVPPVPPLDEEELELVDDELELEELELLVDEDDELELLDDDELELLELEELLELVMPGSAPSICCT